MEDRLIEIIKEHKEELESGVTNKRARQLGVRWCCIRRIRKVGDRRVSLYMLNDEWKQRLKERLEDPRFSPMSMKIKEALKAYFSKDGYDFYSHGFNIICPDIGDDHLKNAILALIIILHAWRYTGGVEHFDVPMKSESEQYYTTLLRYYHAGFDIKIDEEDFDSPILKKLAIALMGYNNIPFECKYIRERWKGSEE